MYFVGTDPNPNRKLAEILEALDAIRSNSLLGQWTTNPPEGNLPNMAVLGSGKWDPYFWPGEI